MPKFGYSMAVVLALAAPAWASYPPPVVSDGYPGAVGYAMPPDMLPPIGGFPTGPMVPPTPRWYGPPSASLPSPVWDPSVLAADPCGFAFDPCFPNQRGGAPRTQYEHWVRGDWLYWNFRNTPVPAMIATGDPNLANPAVPGGGNVTALGAGARDLGAFNGARVTFGRWFDEDGELGAELSGFIFGREGSATFFTDATTPVVAAPVIGANGVAAVYNFAIPGAFTGGLGIRTATQLFGAEANLLHRWRGDGRVSVDGLFGYRYLQLNERVELLGRSLATGEMGTFNGAVLPQGVTVLTTDAFRGRTEFHGAQIGARVEMRYDWFTATAFGKTGAGVNLQVLRVGGNTQATGFGVTQIANGGVRALVSNSGRDTNTEFSMINETGLELGFQVTRKVSLRVGYNVLFWSELQRPGNVIDPVVNFAQVPIDPTFNPAARGRPVNALRSSDFLAHGLVVGVVLDY